MRIAVGQLPAVVQEYFEAVLMPAANQTGGGLRAFGVGVAGGLIVRGVPKMVEEYVPVLKALGLMDTEGMLLVDLLYEEASKAITKTPVVVFGYRVEQTDLDAIRTIAHRHGVP